MKQKNLWIYIWGGYIVYSISDISSIEYDEIWLANSYIDTLLECIHNGIPKEKIVICNEILCEKYCDLNGVLDIKYLKKEAEKYEALAKWEYIHENDREITVVSKALNLHEYVYYTEYIQQFGGVISADDYYRFATLKLLAREIKNNNVEGVVAELGVYRGKFAKCINMEFPDRTLYLFDTFEGNPQQDIKIEESHGYTDFNKVMDYSNTSVELVLNGMLYPNKCVVRKGYFPDTIPQEDLKYSFVSIRTGLYESTLSGLRYFYPRLTKGGYMMISVYNSPFIWRGIKEAVKQYESEEHIVKVPLADAQGCVVIGK